MTNAMILVGLTNVVFAMVLSCGCFNALGNILSEFDSVFIVNVLGNHY